MNLTTLPYAEYLKNVPTSGHHILGQQTSEHILVYQAFNHAIANYAIEHQRFGGNAYSFNRMTWIKPNFLWMMYRCGWAEKSNQERVLGIWITKSGFTSILEQAVYSSFNPAVYQTHENWKAALNTKEVRLQWDPDHDIYGQKQERRAIQLGIKGQMVEQFNQEMITEIMDLTDFVKTQKRRIDRNEISALVVPLETTFKTNDTSLNERLQLK